MKQIYSMSACTVQLATEADVPFIRTLAERVWWAHYPEIISDDQINYMLSAWYNSEVVTAQIRDKSHHYWLVFADGADQPCGYLDISPKNNPGEYYLNKFYIDQRGHGIGASAFYAALAQYPDVQEIRLNVNRRNYKSVNFYFKTGFKIESIMDLEVGEKYIMDDFVMVWKKQ